MKEKSLLLQLTGEMPAFKIIDFLIENKGLDFTKKDIIEGADISKATLFNYWAEVEKAGIVSPTRKFGKTVLFKLNSKNPVVKKILELETELIRRSLDGAKPRKEILVEAR
ncbi:MAG: hypothetical protein AABX39_00895 [Nanoarchaeota archaeon]